MVGQERLPRVARSPPTSARRSSRSRIFSLSRSASGRPARSHRCLDKSSCCCRPIVNSAWSAWTRACLANIEPRDVVVLAPHAADGSGVVPRGASWVVIHRTGNVGACTPSSMPSRRSGTTLPRFIASRSRSRSAVISRRLSARAVPGAMSSSPPIPTRVCAGCRCMPRTSQAWASTPSSLPAWATSFASRWRIVRSKGRRTPRSSARASCSRSSMRSAPPRCSPGR